MSFKSPKYCITYIYFAILVIIATHMIMQTGLSYVNSNYCYRTYYANSGNLTGTYKALYDGVQNQCQVLSES